MAILDKLGRDIAPGFDHMTQYVGTPVVLVLAGMILKSDLDPTAELWGGSPQATALARKWRAEDNVDALILVARAAWPEIRFGYGLVRIDHPSPDWIARNLSRLRAKYLLEPYKDIERVAFILDSLHAEAQHHESGKYSTFSRALMLFDIGRVVQPREVLMSWDLLARMGAIGKAIKRAEKMTREHELAVTP